MSIIKTAVVLAGGMGTRLRSKIGDEQKCLALVSGKPFLFKILDSLAEKNISKVILATGFKANTVEETLGRTYKGIDLLYSTENLPLGTGGALIQASRLVNEDHFLALNGDSYINFSLENLESYHLDKKSKFTILLTKTEASKRFGSVKLDSSGQILSFKEKADTKDQWTNAGVYLINRGIFAERGAEPQSLELEIFPSLIGDSFYGLPSKETAFIDIGTPDTLELADNFFNTDLTLTSP